nr:hypothetical protein [Tanacetum cinerariifolium]
QLDDAEGIVCLPNEEIFAGLALMGYEKPSTKLTFYKAFFSSQWKFLIHTILQSLSAKRTSWNEFSMVMASTVICLSKGQKFNFSKYIFDSLVRNVDSISKFYMYPRFIQLIIQNQVGDFSTHTTRFISPALTQKVFANMRRVRKGFLGVKTSLFEENVVEDVAHDAIPSPPSHDIPSPSQEPSSPPQQPQSSPQAPPQEPGNYQAEGKGKEGRMIDDMDKDEGIKLEDSEVQEVVEVVTTAKLITDVVSAALQVSAASITISAAKPSIPSAALTVVAAYTRRRKGVIIRDPEEELSSKTPAETPKVKDKAQKAANRRKLSEEAQEAEDLRKRLEVVDDEDDDVFIEDTLLARKVPVADYQIVLVDNKPRFKIIKAHETHQLYISFTTLLKNFEREDLENLWGIVKDRFSTSKQTNFSNEYLLLTLKTMFEKPDGQDAVWKNQRSVYGLALVKSWKLLTSCGVHIITLSIV